MALAALIVSIVSVCAAFFALAWNVYRDVFLRPRVRVSVFHIFISHPTMPEQPEFVVISATNLGPGEMTINGIVAMQGTFLLHPRKRARNFVILPDYTSGFGSRLPAKLARGDSAEVYLPYTAQCILKEPITHVGLRDSYGRTHWAPKKQLRNCRAEWRKEFLEAKETPLGPSESR